MAEQVARIDPQDIRPNIENPRIVFREEELLALETSIREQGILVPLTVFSDKSKFTILDGERRWRCAMKLGLRKVPAIVQPRPDRLQNIMMMFAIHKARSDWDPLPTAMKLAQLEAELTKRHDETPSESALAAAASLSRGEVRRYRLTIEKREPGFPFVPAFIGKRRPSTVIVEIASDFPDERMQQWCRFGRSCSADTQVCLVVPTNSRALTKLETIRAARVGLYVVDQNKTVSEIIPPHDLAMIMELPPLDQARPPIRRALGPAYEQIDRGQWREAFETACVALEFELRKYLWHSLHVKRLTIVDKAGIARPFSKKKIMKATLGRVAVLLNSATPHNQLDSLLDTNVRLINRQRIDVAHYKFRREAALRRNVGRHMWSIFQCLDELL